jgi:hypothetical protein
MLFWFNTIIFYRKYAVINLIDGKSNQILTGKYIFNLCKYIPWDNTVNILFI